MAADYLNAGFGRVALTFRFMLRHRIEDHLPEMRMPVLVIRGGRDPICSQPWAEQVARLLPQGKLMVLPEGAHSLHRFATCHLAAIIRPFLAN